MKTKYDFYWYRTCSALPREEGKILIPAGTPVEKLMGNQFFIIPSFFKDDAIVFHDSQTYGCPVDPKNVTGEEFVTLLEDNDWICHACGGANNQTGGQV